MVPQRDRLLRPGLSRSEEVTWFLVLLGQPLKMRKESVTGHQRGICLQLPDSVLGGLYQANAATGFLHPSLETPF